MTEEAKHVFFIGGAAALAGVGVLALLKKNPGLFSTAASKANQAGLVQLAATDSIPNTPDFGAGPATNGYDGLGEPVTNFGGPAATQIAANPPQQAAYDYPSFVESPCDGCCGCGGDSCPVYVAQPTVILNTLRPILGRMATKAQASPSHTWEILLGTNPTDASYSYGL